MRLVLAGLVLVACFANVADAEEPPEPEAVLDVLALLREHVDGEVNCVVDENRTTIAFDAMTYQIHISTKLGRIQPATEQLGPRRGGVVIEIQRLEGSWGGALDLPCSREGPYYVTDCGELVEDGRHYFVKVRFGHHFPKDLSFRILARFGQDVLARRFEPPPAIPVAVEADLIQKRVAVGEPVLVRVALRNGLRTPIRFWTWSKAPVEWNGEADCFELTWVSRDGGRRNLFLRGPVVSVPEWRKGIGATEVIAGGAKRVVIDLAKWTITGGWCPGTYECSVRLIGIQADEQTTLSVTSARFDVVVE